MPIINRIDMLTTGIRSEVGVKIFRTDLTTLETLARRVSDVIPRCPGQQRLPGASDEWPVSQHCGRPIRSRQCGIGVGDIQQVIEHAVGETVLTTTIEGRRRFPVRVRYGPQFRGFASPGTGARGRAR